MEDLGRLSTAEQEVRTQREKEMVQLKKTLDEETANHEAAIASMRQKHTRATEELHDKLDAAKRVSRERREVGTKFCGRGNCC